MIYYPLIYPYPSFPMTPCECQSNKTANMRISSSLHTCTIIKLRCIVCLREINNYFYTAYICFSKSCYEYCNCVHDALTSCYYLDDLVSWEESYGRIPERAAILVNSGWSKKYGTPDFLSIVRDTDGNITGKAPKSFDPFVKSQTVTLNYLIIKLFLWLTMFWKTQYPGFNIAIISLIMTVGKSTNL